MPGRGSFVCICPPKAIEFGADRHLHRVKHEETLRQLLTDVPFKGAATAQIILPGGGIVVETSKGVSYGVHGTLMAVYTGCVLSLC